LFLNIKKAGAKFWKKHFVCVYCGGIIKNKDYSYDNGQGGICKSCKKILDKKEKKSYN